VTRYVGGRLASGLLTLFLFVTLLFFLVNIVIPGDFVSQFILTAEDASAAREALGLNRPLWQQYLSWMSGLATLSLGESFSRGDVWEAIKEAMPATLVVLTIGLGMAFILASWLGRNSAYKGESFFSGALTLIAIIFLTMFPPVLAIVMEEGIRGSLGFVAFGRLGSLDYEGIWGAISENHEGTMMSPGLVMWRMTAVLLITLALLWLLDRGIRQVFRKKIPSWLFLISMVVLPMLVWGQMGLGPRVFDLTGTLFLLIAGVVLLTFGDVLLVTRAAMDDVMAEDYVMVARAKGLPDRQVRNHHAARTALLPVLSRFTVSIPYFLTGLVILEAVFGGSAVAGTVPLLHRVSGPPGMGTLIFDAMRLQDTPLLVGAFLVIGVITLMLRIGLDVAHAALDPRIRFDRATHVD